MDSRQRTLAKTFSYRLFGTAITAGVAWLITREPCLSASLGVLDTCVKIGGYYLHERIWDLINFGRVQSAASGRASARHEGKEDQKWPLAASLKRT
jgi:uncharacterized membrane protein